LGGRPARNPRTGKRVAVSERVFPHFKTGKQLRERLQALG
jgi:integration host factor subunit beta